MKTPQGYSVYDYGTMINCEPRMGVYAEALRRAVTPGCTVIDLGASFGAFALLACQYGAGRVIAIEPDPSIELLMPLARANGCADKITVVRDISTRFTPDAKADVIVSDCRGAIPLFEHHIATITDARERLLKPGGTLLPMRDTIKIALVRSPATYKPYHQPWLSNRYGLDLAEGHRFAVNAVQKAYLRRSALVSPAATLGVLDYRTITEANFDASVALTAERDATVHGLLVWFDAEIAEGLGYSNAPGEPPLVYGQTFLPLATPKRLAEGDSMAVRIRLPLIDGHHMWNWDWQVLGAAGAEPAAWTRQSTFFTHLTSPQARAAVSDQHIPASVSRMALDRDCLELVNGERDYCAIAKEMMKRHPAKLGTYKAALDYVVAFLGRYNR